MNDSGKSDRIIVPKEGPSPCEKSPKWPEFQKPTSFWNFYKEIAAIKRSIRERERILAGENAEDEDPQQAAPANQTDRTQRLVRAAKAGSEGLQHELERIRQAGLRCIV
jgi:hypothetical protein